LKKYGKEWQKVQQHVSTRTSTQARSHAQKFFVKLDKKCLTLEEFLKHLDLKEVETNLLSSGMDNTDYDEEREVNIIANRKLRGSVMNIALPENSEEKKRQEVKSEGVKRKRSELDHIGANKSQKDQCLNSIRRAFEIHANEIDQSSRYRVDKRVKTTEKEERGFMNNGDYEEKQCSESTAVTSVSKIKEKEDEETPFRKLSISNFEPVQPKNKLSTFKNSAPNHGTPQPDRTENMIISQFVFK